MATLEKTFDEIGVAFSRMTQICGHNIDDVNMEYAVSRTLEFLGQAIKIIGRNEQKELKKYVFLKDDETIQRDSDGSIKWKSGYSDQSWNEIRAVKMDQDTMEVKVHLVSLKKFMENCLKMTALELAGCRWCFTDDMSKDEEEETPEPTRAERREAQEKEQDDG